MKLPFNIVHLTPTNSISRKNIGYLFAVLQNAEVIFDMDEYNVPIPVYMGPDGESFNSASSGMFIPYETADLKEFQMPHLNKEIDSYSPVFV
jgi:hypothetical protein